MTGCGRLPLFEDHSTLPEEERALLERARSLIPPLAERVPAATAARQLPGETIAEYHAAGILRILQPKRFGGMQGRFSLFSRIVEELTYGCAASAWVWRACSRARCSASTWALRSNSILRSSSCACRWVSIFAFRSDSARTRSASA